MCIRDRFYADAASEAVVRRVAAIEKGRAEDGFHVLIEPLAVFHEAEEYHCLLYTSSPRAASVS